MGTYVPTVIAPVLIIALSIPLIARKVGRNYFYGFRTRRTLASDAIWYPANHAGGILLLCAGVAWLTTGVLAPSAAVPVGLATLAVAIAGWAVYMRTLPR